MTRKEQIHAAIYNAAVDAGFMLTVFRPPLGLGRIMVKDLIKDTYNDGIADFEVTFTGNDISDMNVHVEGVDNNKQISNSLI